MSRNVKASAVYQGAYMALIGAGVPAEKADLTAAEIAQAAIDKVRESTCPHKALKLGLYRIGANVGATHATGRKGQKYYWSDWNISNHVMRVIEGEAGAQQRTQRRLLFGSTINGEISWQDLCSIEYALESIRTDRIEFLEKESAAIEAIERSVLRPFTLPKLVASKKTTNATPESMPKKSPTATPQMIITGKR